MLNRSASDVLVKICGLRTRGDVDAAIDAGADALGFVMSPGSKRNLTASDARALIEHTAGRATTVLVVNDTPAASVAALAREIGADVVQLHNYSAEETALVLRDFPRVWRATSLNRSPDLHVGAHGEEVLLLDSSSAGSGERWDLGDLETGKPDGPWVLAGGLSPENVAEAIHAAKPWGVDVSSGVESAPGVKDHARIAEFVRGARQDTRGGRGGRQPETMPIRAAVITVSDRAAAAQRADAAGPVAVEALRAAGFDCAEASIIADGAENVEAAVRAALGDGARLVITSGGTGIAPRDRTPEGTARVIEREVPGIAEQLRNQAAGEAPGALCSRGLAGVAGDALIVNLPGSPKAVAESMPLVLSVAPHALDQLTGGDHV